MGSPLAASSAGALFWMERYRERADFTCRMVSACLFVPAEAGAPAPKAWAALIANTGNSAGLSGLGGNPGAEQVLRFILWDPRNPVSARAAAASARSNALEAAHLLPSELVEAVVEWERTFGAAARAGPELSEFSRVLAGIRSRGHAAGGAMDSLMERSEAWHFARLGLLIERADNTARILAALRQRGSGCGSDARWRSLEASAVAQAFGLSAGWRASGEAADSHRRVAWLLSDAEDCPRSLSACCKSIGAELATLSDGGTAARSIRSSLRELSALIPASRRRPGDFIAANLELSRRIEAEFGFGA